MKDKVVLVVFDGLGDRPVAELDGLTPLEAASTPTLDRIAQSAECGLMHTLGRGLTPGSDTAHIAILGYDPGKDYSGRGPIEVAGLGLELKAGDVAMRGNFGTVGPDMVILDRRAGRVTDTDPLTKALDGTVVDGVTFVVKRGVAHRAGVVMRGEGLSSAITDADPHHGDVPVQKVTATDDNPDSKRTAEILNKFLALAHERLQDHEFNKKRRAEGLPEANFLLVRGAGQYHAMDSFEHRFGLHACCIAGGGLYKGVAAFLGMTVLDVKGATALPTTNLDGKFETAIEKLNEFDFIFVHLKATDNLGEDGKFNEKKAFIERADKAMVRLLDLPEEVRFVITADHSTPCSMKAHSADPVPIMFRGSGVRVDNVKAFGERACIGGGIGFIEGKDVMPRVINLLGRAPLMGA